MAEAGSVTIEAIFRSSLPPVSLVTGLSVSGEYNFILMTISLWNRCMLTPWILKLHMNSAGTTHRPPLILFVTTCPTALNQTNQDSPWETVYITLWSNKGIVSQAHLCLTVLLSCYMMSPCDTCRQHVCPTKPVR